MLRSAALHVGSGTLAAEEARIRTRLIRARQRETQAEQFWMIATLEDREKRARRSAEETRAVMAATAEAPDRGAQHSFSVALLPQQGISSNPVIPVVKN